MTSQIATSTILEKEDFSSIIHNVFFQSLFYSAFAYVLKNNHSLYIL